jgi:hypothetical protein
LPPGHALHLHPPGLALKEPAAHLPQLEEPWFFAYLPIGQLWHVASLLVPLAYLPHGHFLHTLFLSR